MSQKTQAEMQQSISSYLNKTSQHLFTNGKGLFIKILTFKSDGKDYYAKLIFGENTSMIVINEHLSDATWKYHGNNSLAYLKTSIFGPKGSLKSLPYFKAARAITNEIQQELDKGYSRDQKWQKTLEDKLKQLVQSIPLEKAV